MPLPFSKNQVRNLGKRLRDAETPAPENLDLLAEVLSTYDAALSEAAGVLSDLGLRTSGRLKNTGTILEKLRRDRSTNLQNVQDLAGLRVFLGPADGRRRQDDVVTQIVDAFLSTDQQPRVSDRRVAPSRGYRAVHVVVYTSGVPVEIQVRTRAQHEWAEFFERLADQCGRDIRYPDGIPDPDVMLAGLTDEARSTFEPRVVAFATREIDVALTLADLIAEIEVLEEGGLAQTATAPLRSELRDLMTGVQSDIESLTTALRQLRSTS